MDLLFCNSISVSFLTKLNRKAFESSAWSYYRFGTLILLSACLKCCVFVFVFVNVCNQFDLIDLPSWSCVSVCGQFELLLALQIH